MCLNINIRVASKYVKPYYKNKGRTAKTFSTTQNEWVYLVANNMYQLFGSEGVKNGSTKVVTIGNGRISAKPDLGQGERCHVQDNFYDYPKASQPSSSSLPIDTKAKFPFKAGTFKTMGKRKVDDTGALSIIKRLRLETAPRFNISIIFDSEDDTDKKDTSVKVRKLRKDNTALRGQLR